MRRTTTIAVVVTMLLALFAGAALANHSVIDCKNTASPPSCGGTDADDDMSGTPSDDKMAGGGGDDLMYGLDGKDTVSGGAGEDMLGGDFEDSGAHEFRLLFLTANGKDPGEDEFYGGPGTDEIYARECETEGESGSETCTSSTAPTPDIIDCGPGKTDFASFDKKPNVKDVVRNCERLEWKPDNLGQNQPCAAQKPWDNANVKCIGGSDGPNKNILDRDNPDARIVDNMAGFAGDDTLRARHGFDILSGGKGNDTLYGGPGDDRLDGASGEDTIDAGDGDDIIDAEEDTVNQQPDNISCGGGDDDWVWIRFEFKDPSNPQPTDVSIDINKSTGRPFTWEDVTPGLPHDSAKAPAGCEYIADGEPVLGDWLRKLGKPKKHKR